MHSILDRVIGVIETIPFDVKVPKENILKDYPTEMPAFTKPYIFVRELNNLPYERTMTHTENHSLVSYEVEIYSKQQKAKGVILSADEVVRHIGFKINDELATVLGLTRVGAPSPIPYSYDNTVKRYILSFEGVIDLANGYIYRR